MAIADRINEMYTHVGDVYDTITNVDVNNGKNLFNYNDITTSAYYTNNYDGSFTRNSNGSSITINVDTASVPYDTFSLLAGTYSVSFDITTTSAVTINNWFLCTKQNGTGSNLAKSIGVQIPANTTTHIKAENYVVLNNAEKVGFAGYLNASTGVVISNIQVEKGTTASEYQPYTDTPTYKNIENIPKVIRNSYLEIMNNGIDKIWNNWEKVTGEGETLTLNSTEEAPMKINLKGNTSQATLPSEYTAVDYIQSSGTQYIDTGHILNANDVIDITYDYVARGFVFGSRTNNTTNYTGIANEDTGQYNIRMGNTIIYHNNITPQGTINVHIENGNTKINNEVVSTTNYGTNYYNGSCFLFTMNNSGRAITGDYARNRIRYFKIKDVIELIPCYRNSDNEIGMYDLVNNVFYTNAGTGAFTYGAVATLPNPDYPQDIHVVSGDNSINVVGKNLVDYDNNTNLENKVLNASGSFESAIYTYVNGTIKTSNNKITISFNNRIGDAYVRIGEYKIDGTFIKRTLVTTTPTTLTLDNNTSYIIYSIDKRSGVYFDKLQIEINDQATTYEAYQSQSYPISLGDIELCKIGDYQDSIVKDNDKWYLNKQIGKVVLNGSESWGQATSVVSGTARYYYTNASVYHGAISQDNIVFTISKMLKGITWSQIYSGDTTTKNAISNYMSDDSSSGRIVIRIADEIVGGTNNLTNFKSWLSNNNTTVYYVLATPTYTEITDSTLLDQLETFYNAKSKNSQTNISQENNDLPFILDVTALKQLTQ